jgi:hypothetical protein
MSNSLAIAAVTATLRQLLQDGITAETDLNDTVITMQPPDRARTNGTNTNQLNIFLYQTLPNAALRNSDMPGRANPGERAMPPLALNLFYLLTAYGRDNDQAQPFSQQVLGRAMSILHDHPLLLRDEVQAALPASDLHAQLERVRFTLQPLTVEDIFKLWSGFQTQYRLSVAYEASVVLIDSTLATSAALPVLTRGQDNSGITAHGSVASPFPLIETISAQQPAAQFGDTITITGQHFDAGTVTVLFQNYRLRDPIRVDPLPGGTAVKIQVTVNTNPAVWNAGFYSVSLEVKEKPGTPDERIRITNEIPFAIAPTITSTFPISAALATNQATVDLTTAPDVTPDQRVAIFLDDREIPADPLASPGNTLHFQVNPAMAGSYLVRLRVDGVDSLLVDRSGSKPVYRDQRVVIA